MEAFIITNMKLLEDKPWFTSLIAACAVLLVLAFMSRTGIEILTNIKKALTMLKIIAPPRRPLKELFEAEDTANKELDLLAKDYAANRACLALFQNGEKSANDGVCFFGLTVKAEGSDGAFPRIGHRIQKIPLRMYGDWPMRLTYNADIRVHDINDIIESHPEAYFLLSQNSVKSMYAVPVGSTTGGIDGCVFVEYCEETRILDDVEMTAIRSRAQAIYTKLHEANNV